MVNYLGITENPKFKFEFIFEVIRDFRKGGLHPNNYDEFMTLVKGLPPISKRSPADYLVFKALNLSDLPPEDLQLVLREAQARAAEKAKRCWHPQAGIETCNVDKGGNILVSAAHSIQNNGILSRISRDGHVMTFAKDKPGFDGKMIGRRLASIFLGFCNKHDAIFRPIETLPYTGTVEQNFLFAYRGFIVAVHKKVEGTILVDFGEQADNDIKETKKIFDRAIISKDYTILETEVFELPAFYPVAASSSFYLDFDFEGNAIPHSDERMENIYISLFPDNNKTYFLISYLKQDANLYKKLTDQLRKRNKLQSDITILLAPHVGNIYFEPIYFTTFIEKQADGIHSAFIDAQFDYNIYNENNQVQKSYSLTPNNYLNNPYNLNFFGY